MHFFTWVFALWLPIALQLNFKSLETVIDLLIVLTNCLNRLQNRKYTLTLNITKEDEVLETTDEFYERINKMNEQVKQKYEFNNTNQDDNTNQEDDTNQEEDNTNQEDDTNQEQDDTNQEDDSQLDLEQFNQEQYYKEMEEMQEQINQLSHSIDSTPEEYKDIDTIVAKVNSVNNKVYIDESLE